MLEKIKKNRILWILFSVLVVVLLGLIYAFLIQRGTQVEPETFYPLKVTCVDVGQGDGIVVQCDKTVLVIDGGEAERAGSMTDYLKKENIRSVDCYIASHPHSDHIGAADQIFKLCDVKNVMMTSFSELNVPTTVSYEYLLNAVSAEKCEVLFAGAGDSYTFGDLKLDVLAPFEETGEYNNMSLVIRMTYMENTFLFTGDVEADVERQLLDAGTDVSAQVLKVAHHGSKTSSGDAFIAAVSPRYALISCGQNNEYGHPDRQTLEILEKYGVEILRTDRQGDLTVYGDGKDVIAE